PECYTDSIVVIYGKQSRKTRYYVMMLSSNTRTRLLIHVYIYPDTSLHCTYNSSSSKTQIQQRTISMLILYITYDTPILYCYSPSLLQSRRRKKISYSIEIETLEIYKLEVDDATHVIGKHFKSFTDPGSSMTTPASTRTVSPTLTDFRYQARHPIIRHTIYCITIRQIKSSWS